MKTERKRKLQKVWGRKRGREGCCVEGGSNRTGEVDQEFSPGLFCGFDSHWPTPASRYFPSFTPPKGIHSVCVCVCGVSLVTFFTSFAPETFSSRLRSAAGVILGFFEPSATNLSPPPFCFLKVQRRTTRANARIFSRV